MERYFLRKKPHALVERGGALESDRPGYQLKLYLLQ